jgi:hypothetical protein
MTNHPIKYESYRTISDQWHSQNEEGWTDERKNEKLYVYIPILSYTDELWDFNIFMLFLYTVDILCESVVARHRVFWTQ